MAAARELARNGMEVLAVDIDEAVVNTAAMELACCKRADVADMEALKQLGVSNVDVVIVAMAGNLEASVLTTMLCKEIGVKTVVAKCAGETHRKLLEKVGADRVVFPENDSGTRLAKNLLSSGFVDVVELSGNVSLVELDVKPEWENRTLLELQLRKKRSINVVAVRTGKTVVTDIDPERKLDKSMKLIVIGETAKIRKLQS